MNVLEILKRLSSPSAAIRKRLSVFIGEMGEGHRFDDDIHRMKAVARCFEIVDRMPLENMLFHGYGGLESCVRVFAEHAVDVNEPHYEKCLDILSSRKDGDALYKRGLTKNAEAFEGMGYSASKAIRASLLICSGIGSEKETKPAIQHSLECFKAVLGYERLEDFAYQKNGKWVYLDGKLFPDYYNLRILAFSSSWKTPDAIESLTKAVNRLAELQPLPSVYVNVKGQLVAPGSYLMHDFDSRFLENGDNAKAEWLSRNEYFSRMGALNPACGLLKVKESINDAPGLMEGICGVRTNTAFSKWGAYSGLSLEDNWLRKERRINDLAFRAALIHHYSDGFFN